MGKSTVVPFGPQHPVLPEPIHFDLELEDEKVVKAIPSIGYVHRGLEKLYSKAIEGLMEIEIPKRAEYLRTIWHEISRLHSHLLWAGLGADALGFESLFMQCWRIRETILDIIEQTTGGRVIFSVCKVGGVRRDIPDNELKEIVKRLDALKKEIDGVAAIFLNDETIHMMKRWRLAA